MPRIFPLVCLLLAMLIVSGCSRTALLYDNADWMAVRWVSSLLDPDDRQEEQWQDMFGEVVEQHRAQLLPEVVALLHELEQQAVSGIRSEFLECWLQAADDSYRRHVDLLIPTAVDVLRDMRPAQVDHLEAEFEERNNDYRERMRLGETLGQRDARVDRYVERIERWTGSLDDGQIDWLALQLDRLPDVAGAWLDYRRQRQAGLLELLRADATASELHAYLESWWQRFDQRAADLERDTLRLRHGMVALIGDLDRKLSSRQREALVDNVRDLRVGLQSASRQVDVLAKTGAPVSTCAGGEAI
jgi:hypothetical protein